MPLTYLTEMKRLDTLVIHIDESRTRRPSEDSSLIQYAVAATAGQPNHRMKRYLIEPQSAMKLFTLTYERVGLYGTVAAGIMSICQCHSTSLVFSAEPNAHMMA